MGLLRISWCLSIGVLLSSLVFAQENDTECSEKLSNLGTGFELVTTRLEQLQLNFMEVFGHIKELGEVVVNNQQTVKQSQLQTNQIVHGLDDQVSANVSRMVDYSKQILDLQTICANHDFIREELLRINPALSGSSCYHSYRSSRRLIIPKDTNLKVVESCANTSTTISGLFRIPITTIDTPVPVYCEMQRFGGGWLVIQQRFDGSVSFYRKWAEYKSGFGTVGAEFWLGLEKIHQITKQGTYELMIELENHQGGYTYARYTEFAIGTESERYAITKLGTFSGNSNDGFTYHKGKKFSTQDYDNDGYSSYNMAQTYYGAWWYDSGLYSNLNGPLTSSQTSQSMFWYSTSYPQKYSRMMIRKK